MAMKFWIFVWKFIVVTLVAAIFVGCSKYDLPNREQEGENSAEEERLLKANQFVYDYTRLAYLWEEYIPANVSYRSADNPQELFELMRYSRLDSWSYVTDNSQETLDEFKGVSTTFGYSLSFGRFSNDPEHYFAVVRFVYPNSPAQAAGLKRGDFIVTVGGEKITTDNYRKLYYGSSIVAGLGRQNPGGVISLSGVEVSMTAVKMYEDPVVEYSVIDAGGVKVGYLFYAGFYAESHEKLVEVFEWFKENGVSELILDLRYNLGGNAKTPPYLSSMIAPQSVIEEKSVFYTEKWNRLFMEFYKDRGDDMNVYFHPDIPVNLNLNRVYILVTESTASASEATITGLMPYMDVVKIGSSSYGKCCGAALFSPKDDDGNVDKEIGNWLLSLVIYKFVNADGYTDFNDGIPADYEVADTGLLTGIPLGDVSDPMIAKALEIITGSVQTKSAGMQVPQGVEILPHLGENPLKGGMMKFTAVPAIE